VSTTRHLKDERGAVAVMVALFLPLMLIFASFAIDSAHYFDFSRSLQNRADAAVFSAALEYGNTCFNATPTQAQLDAIGQAAQQYSGPPGAAASLPYPYTLPPAYQPYQNTLDLPGANAANFHMVLNGATSADHGGTSFSKGTFCSATYDTPADPATDVWLTQEHVPLFLPLFGFAPNISAHARVQLQGIQSETGVRPLAVGDAAYIPCVTANFLNKDGAVIASEKLTKIGNSSTWSSIGNAKQIQMPAGDNPVTVQMFLWDCSTGSPSGLKYDYYNNKGQETQLGLVYINNWGTPTAVGATGAPQLAAGGLHLTGTNMSTCDPYFQSSTVACAVGVHANIQFQPAGGGGTFFARACLDGTTTSNGTCPTPINLTHTASPGPTDWDSNLNTFTIAADSGPHTVTIQWAQLGGKVGATTCKTTGSAFAASNGCKGILQDSTGTAIQRLMSGTNGTNACNNPPYDTGPLQWVDVGTTDNPVATAGANSYAQGANPHLYITTSIQGLSNALPTDPDICLRVAEQVSHATDFVNCGQGNGTNQDISAIENGCPDPPGVQKNVRLQPDGSLTCVPQITPWDCVGNNPGESSPVLKGFDQLIGQGNAPGNCAPNNWNSGNPITLADPRAVVMIITGPSDLGTTNGTGQIPIRDFAVFYVTGWSTGMGGVKGCNNNDPPPAGAGNGELWGHWTSIAVPSGSGTSNGQQCDTAQFGNCVAVLTR
jgi:Putative Flp pilus-assembly TadE/G-like